MFSSSSSRSSSVILLGFVVVSIIISTAFIFAKESKKESSSSSSSSPVITPECYDPHALLDGIASGQIQTGDERWNDADLTHPQLPNFTLETTISNGCQLRRIPLAEMDKKRFELEFLEKEAVVFTGNSNRTALFRQLMQKNILLHCFGNHLITLSTANQYSYLKTETSFRDYVDNHMSKPQSLNTSGVDTKYHFGDNKHSEWDHFFDLYPKPTEIVYDAKIATLSFGLAGTGTGVPSHTHGHVFAEVFYGKKRWWISLPSDKPRFESDGSVLRWVLDVLPTYSEEEKSKMMDCTIAPGEILYIPTHWWHSTFNMGEAVFMSTFV